MASEKQSIPNPTAEWINIRLMKWIEGIGGLPFGSYMNILLFIIEKQKVRVRLLRRWDIFIERRAVAVHEDPE